MKVSIAMIAYNHERFIKQSIESVLMQETTLDYELVIGEDCSTDRTREIVIEAQKKYPNKIRLLLPETNLGMHRNLSQTLAACEGEYIALLEGDDYWIATDKLREQVDYLENHPECSMCFHPVIWSYDDEKYAAQFPVNNSIWPAEYREFSSAEDLIKEIFIQTASVMFRRAALPEYPKWLYGLPIADWPVFILLADKGKIGCLDRAMSVYRRHEGGVWFAVAD